MGRPKVKITCWPLLNPVGVAKVYLDIAVPRLRLRLDVPSPAVDDINPALPHKKDYTVIPTV